MFALYIVGNLCAKIIIIIIISFSLHQFLGLTHHGMKLFYLLIFLKTCFNPIRIQQDKSIELGPWGGNGGCSWNDGVHSGIREISIVYGSCIDSICVTYDKFGKPFLGEKHGGMGGTKAAQVHFGPFFIK